LVQKPSGGGCAFDPENPVNRGAIPFSNNVGSGRARNLKNRDCYTGLSRLPGVYVVPTSDLCPGKHPPHKSGYGLRAARVALGAVYQQEPVWSGPLYRSHAIDGDRIRIRFDHVGSGLVAAHSDRVQGFHIASPDGAWHPAEAQIEGDEVVVHAAGVAEPKAARYAYDVEIPWANLFNREGLPALTFQCGEPPEAVRKRKQ
jgi:sialate O-acetylesterase